MCSIAINSTVSNGYQVYRCNARGAWQPSYRSATLRNAKNESIILGTYVNYYVPKYHQLNAGIWTLVNSAADRSESGHVSSIVAGYRLYVNTSHLQTHPFARSQSLLHLVSMFIFIDLFLTNKIYHVMIVFTMHYLQNSVSPSS